MDENLINKKELLVLTGISYGSLYRWKRKNLIPDDWFIHRSTFTGHETFFPKNKILDRIARIQALKEEMSLDDIAETLDPKRRDVQFTLADVEKRGIASRRVIDLYLARYGDRPHYDFDGLFSIYLFNHLLNAAQLTRDEVGEAMAVYAQGHADMPDTRLICLRKLGVFLALMVPEGCAVTYDADTAVIAELSVETLISELKELLGKEDTDARK